MEKSQAAMEFLLSYGWAILLGIVAISALAYFGVIDANKLKPSMCSLPAGLSCQDYSYDEGVLHLSLNNAMGKSIKITSIVIEGCDPYIRPIELANGEMSGSINIGCTKPTGSPKIAYKLLDTGLEHKIEGTLSAKGDEADTSGTHLTNRVWCSNANNIGYCAGIKNTCFDLNPSFGDCNNYAAQCCIEWNLCC